jgi:S1-C subfamily serine protease
MKKTHIISGLIALVVTVTTMMGYDYFKGRQDKTAKTLQVNSVETVPAQKVLYAANTEGEIIPLDFTKTTDKVLDAVVHIQAKQKSAKNRNGLYQYRQLPDAFKDFFGDRQFGQFFQRPQQAEPREDEDTRMDKPVKVNHLCPFLNLAKHSFYD